MIIQRLVMLEVAEDEALVDDETGRLASSV
jgi:hypothetical protein